jgi:hypothetical protein
MVSKFTKGQISPHYLPRDNDQKNTGMYVREGIEE